jgi:hypothetical protein
MKVARLCESQTRRASNASGAVAALGWFGFSSLGAIASGVYHSRCGGKDIAVAASQMRSATASARTIRAGLTLFRVLCEGFGERSFEERRSGSKIACCGVWKGQGSSALKGAPVKSQRPSSAGTFSIWRLLTAGEATQSPAVRRPPCFSRCGPWPRLRGHVGRSRREGLADRLREASHRGD